MSLENNIILNLYSIAVLLIIYFHASKFFERDSLSDKLYMLILYVTMLLLAVDILSRFDGNSSMIYPVFNQIGNFLSFFLSPVLPSLWVAYVHFYIFPNERKTKGLFYPLCILNVLNASALVISQLLGFGWFYYIDTENIYHRGPFFLIPAFITIILMLVAFVIIVKNRKSLGNKTFFSLIFFAIPPFVSIILQIAFYGISFMLNSVVLSLLVVFLNIQNYSIHTDHLTGLNNRRKLDAYLKEKINLCTSDKVFSIILLDINDFKCINDTYGHNIGDNALETAAKLLKSCLRARDFIARYGGDEFCIVIVNENPAKKGKKIHHFWIKKLFTSF